MLHLEPVEKDYTVMVTWLLMERDLFRVCSEMLAHQKQPYGTFMLCLTGLKTH